MESVGRLPAMGGECEEPDAAVAPVPSAKKKKGGVSLVIGVFLVLASLSWVFQAFLFRGIAHGVSAFVVVDETCAAI